MVLISIIIGLGITNLLLGLSGAIERFTESTRPLRISWATIFWLAHMGGNHWIRRLSVAACQA